MTVSDLIKLTNDEFNNLFSNILKDANGNDINFNDKIDFELLSYEDYVDEIVWLTSQVIATKLDMNFDEALRGFVRENIEYLTEVLVEDIFEALRDNNI